MSPNGAALDMSSSGATGPTLLQFEDLLVHISQFCNWRELLKLARLCNLTMHLAQTNRDCWVNTHLSSAEITRLAKQLKRRQRKLAQRDGHLAEVVEVEQDTGKCFSIRSVLQHNRLLGYIGNLTMDMSEINAKELRDQLQMFKQLQSIHWRFSKETISHEQFEKRSLNNLACPLVNESAATLTAIRLSGKMISHLEWLHSNTTVVFPQLISLELAVCKDQIVHGSTLISRYLPNLKTLRLWTRKRDNLEPEQILLVVSPIIERMQRSLTVFETNLRLTPELILRFLDFAQLTLIVRWHPQLIQTDKAQAVVERDVSIAFRRNSYSSSSSSSSSSSTSSNLGVSDSSSDDDDVSIISQYPEQDVADVGDESAERKTLANPPINPLKVEPCFSSQDIQFLAACKEFHQPPRHHFVLSVGTSEFTHNETQFATFLSYTRKFRESLYIEHWTGLLAPNLSPWTIMSTCTALTEIEVTFPIRCRLKPVQEDQVNLEQIQCLRPIYKQLCVFRLVGCYLKLSTLSQLTRETEQLTNLIHKDVFIECNILPDRPVAKIKL